MVIRACLISLIYADCGATGDIELVFASNECRGEIRAEFANIILRHCRRNEHAAFHRLNELYVTHVSGLVILMGHRYGSLRHDTYIGDPF